MLPILSSHSGSNYYMTLYLSRTFLLSGAYYASIIIMPTCGACAPGRPQQLAGGDRPPVSWPAHGAIPGNLRGLLERMHHSWPWSDEVMLTSKCARNACMTNSSATLNTFPALSTCVRRITSLRLQSEPGCAGDPQNISSNTFKHSQRK